MSQNVRDYDWLAIHVPDGSNDGFVKLQCVRNEELVQIGTAQPPGFYVHTRIILVRVQKQFFRIPCNTQKKKERLV